MNTEKWFIIINPNAGVKKGARRWPLIHDILREEQVDFDFRLTERKEHATEITLEAVALGYRNFCVVGGDGTLNEVLNGLMLQQVVPVSELLLGMIPLGTGNDWCRTFDIPFDHHKAVQVLKNRKTTVQDIGKVTFQWHGINKTRYFMNVAGMGYDALVAKKTNLSKERGRGGALVYFYFVFGSLFQYKFMEAVVEVDGNTVYKGEIFSMNAGICRYSGGGMLQVPGAIPDDGQIDLTLIKKAPKWVVIRYVNKLYDGTLVNLPIVITARGKHIRIRSTGKVYLETDGESLGHSPLDFEIIPTCLRVITNSGVY